MLLSPQQSKILNNLLPVARLAVSNACIQGDLHARTHTLICAPSGSGKSHLMRKLGELLNVPVLLLNVSTWQPQGSHGDNYTWGQIVLFLRRTYQGVIVLDELDKLEGNSDWLGFVRLEIHDLLDGVIPMSVEIKNPSSDADDWFESNQDEDDHQSLNYRVELEEKLRTGVFLVGGGAWQSLWQAEKVDQKTIGFLPSVPNVKQDRKVDHKKLQTSIAPELLRRFRHEVLVMEPMNESEYLQILPGFLKSISRDLRKDFRKLAESQISEAVKSNLGMRFFEEILTQALVKNECRKLRPKKEEIIPY